MVKKTLFSKAVLGLIVLVILLSGCTKTNIETVDPTSAPKSDVKFNEGAVEYAIEKIEYNIGEFPSEKLGEPVRENDEGVEVLFSETFYDGDPRCGDEAIEYSFDSCSVEDGLLCVPADCRNQTSHGWTTWAPKAECFDKDYLGTQISLDCILHSDGKSNWESAFFGLFKDNYSTIADNASGGMYLSFNPVSGNITVYCSKRDNWNWPAGNVSVGVDKELFEGNVKLDILTIGREKVKVYIGGEIVLTIQFNEETGRFEVLNASGKTAGKGSYDPDLLNGSFFQIFTHLGYVCVDDLKILACSKGVKKVENIVTAKPVEGHKLGLDITDKKDIVSICYSVWHNAINGMGTGPINNISDVTELLKTHDFTTEKGFVNKTTGVTNNALTKFHYWGKPAQGYYRSSDTNAIRNNMTLLYEAGVDFIIIDFTYATAPGYAPGTGPWESYINSSITPLLDTIMLMRAEGKGTPYVVFWMGNDSMFEYMDEQFLSVGKWQDCFVYWEGKPFIMKWEMNDYDSYEKWTVRAMYGLRGKADVDQWSYLEIDNSKTVAYDRNGEPEHMCVDVATQETYMSVSTAHGRQGGKFFNRQWKNAFAVHPKIVTVTWWNEWCAQLYLIDGFGYIFTDNFNEEYSRDIEPQDGKNGDTYYKWLCRYIEDYRAGKKCPELLIK